MSELKIWRTLGHSTPSELVELAVTAEQAGLHGVMLADHLFVPDRVHTRYPYSSDGKVPWDLGAPWPDPWPVLAAVAASTQRIRLATNIVVLPLRDPIELARTLATVSLLADGRVALGVGAGWMAEEYRARGIEFSSRGRRYDEALTVLRRLWTGESVEFRGEFFDFPGLRINPAPATPIPVYLGGPSRRAMRRAAEHGDGWISGALPIDRVPEAVHTLHTLRAAAGRDVEPFEIFTFAPRDPDHLRRLRDLGVTAVIDIPPRREAGPGTTLEQRRDAIRRFADAALHAL